MTGAELWTVYFSDRPDHVDGTIPTHTILNTLGFTPVNPPNAAVVARTADGGEDVLLVELPA